MPSLSPNVSLEASSDGVLGVSHGCFTNKAISYNDVFLVITSPWPGSTTSQH